MVDLQLMKSICNLNDDDLGENLLDFLIANNYDEYTYSKGNYIMGQGDLPICLIAHIDTVFAYTPNKDSFLYDQEKQILWSPYGSGFDDRAGIAMIIQLILHGYKPSVIFTFDEEVGGEGAKTLITECKTCPIKNCKALIELDRANEKDCVFYQCENRDFVKYIEGFGFVEAQGTFTDISFLAPAWKIAAVNLSIGYIDEHTTSERLNLIWYNQTFKKLMSILDNSQDMKFYKYIPKKVQHIMQLGSRNKCFLCNAPLWKKKKKVKENNVEFYCCEECYDEYYNDFLDIF